MRAGRTLFLLFLFPQRKIALQLARAGEKFNELAVKRPAADLAREMCILLGRGGGVQHASTAERGGGAATHCTTYLENGGEAPALQLAQTAHQAPCAVLPLSAVHVDRVVLAVEHDTQHLLHLLDSAWGRG